LDAELLGPMPKGAYHIGCKKGKRIKADVGRDVIAILVIRGSIALLLSTEDLVLNADCL
jgi:hypothetical protein